ncbi:unnamed protein product, partial [Ectocarpus sp. 12 AP-2014]
MDVDVGGGVRASGIAIRKNGLDSPILSCVLPQASISGAADSTAAAALSPASGSNLSTGAAVVLASGGAWSRVANAACPEMDNAGGEAVS